MTNTDYGQILQTEVNSALINRYNHTEDNRFMDCDISTFASEIETLNLEPIGICKNVPFKPSYAEYSVAFCFKYKGEIYWCHMTETIWFSLLGDIYGRKKADEIISSIMKY